MDSAPLHVHYYIEPCCLGPEGHAFIEAFCEYGNKVFQTFTPPFIELALHERTHSSQAELTYVLGGQPVTREQARAFLEQRRYQLDAFEEHLHDDLSHLVEDFLGR